MRLADDDKTADVMTKSKHTGPRVNNQPASLAADERRFLEQYDPRQFDIPLVTVDVEIFAL